MAHPEERSDWGVGTDPELDAPLHWLRQCLDGQGPRRVVVGLIGLPGSGKSTLAGRLVARLNREQGPDTALALGMDGFHLTRAQLAGCADPVAALARRGAPWTFDPEALADRLRMVRAMALAAGPAPNAGATRWPVYEHGVGDPVADAIAVPATTRLVLLEGLYLLHDDHGWNLRGLLDACAYLDVGVDQAMERLTRRHMASWGMDRPQAEARVQANDRLNAQFVVASRLRADVLIPARCAGL